MQFKVVWSASATNDLENLFDYLVEQGSAWNAETLCQRLVQSTDWLAEFPRLYEETPEYGNGVRRISLGGYHVLYEIDGNAQIATILAVVGQRQRARNIL